MGVARSLRIASRTAHGGLRLRASDVLVASFPRSGSTQLRMILAGLTPAGRQGPLTHDRFEQVVPELGSPSSWRRPPDLPLFVKTHRPYSFLLARPRAVLLLRSPLDALASFYAYRSALVRAPEREPGAFLRDARRGLPAWIAHTRSWVDRAEHVLRFSDLRDRPVEAIGGLLEALEIPCSPDALHRVIARATPEAAEHLRSTRRAGDVLDPAFVFARPDSRAPRFAFSPEDADWAHRQLEQAGLTDLVATV